MKRWIEQWRHSDRVAYAILRLRAVHPVNGVRYGRYGRGYGMSRRTLLKMLRAKLLVEPFSWQEFWGDRFVARCVRQAYFRRAHRDELCASEPFMTR